MTGFRKLYPLRIMLIEHRALATEFIEVPVETSTCACCLHGTHRHRSRVQLAHRLLLERAHIRRQRNGQGHARHGVRLTLRVDVRRAEICVYVWEATSGCGGV